MKQVSRSGSTARLIVGPATEGRVLALSPLPFTLGRSVERHLCVPDPRVSREHALIDRDADGFFIRDLGSRHGTYVNGIPIAGNQSRLRNQDSIVLGTCSESIIFEEMEDQSTTRSLLTQISQAGSANNDLETLSLFLKAAQSLNSHGALNDVLQTMVDYTIRLTQAERGFVFLGADAEDFKLAYASDEQGHLLTEEMGISRSLVQHAAESEHDFVLADAFQEAELAARKSLLLHDIRSVAAIPLRGPSSERLLGVLYLDSRRAGHDFSKMGKEILHVIARQAATLLENLTMLEAEREAALLRKELEIAASIQRQIIPQDLPVFPGVRLAAQTVPCTGVGGDFYDVIPVPEGFVAVVADVSGKGVPAALLAAMVQGMLHALITGGATLVDAITQVSRFLCSRTPIEKYLTLAVLRYAPAPDGSAQVEVVNAGHVLPVIVRHDGAVEELPDGDMPVGMFDFATFHSLALRLHPGDRIVLLSDGVTEAQNAAGEQFGDHQMQAAFTQSDTVPNLFAALSSFCAGVPPQDDQTVLTLEVLV